MTTMFLVLFVSFPVSVACIVPGLGSEGVDSHIYMSTSELNLLLTSNGPPYRD